MPKPPIDPDSFDKVNFVIDAWTQGCDAPWYIYVETMKPALLTAFITLITFGLDDVIRGYFRPKGLYQRRWAKRKGKWARRLPSFPELGNTLGKNLPMAERVRGLKWSRLGKTLWRIDGAMESVRFFWLVAAITEDFAFDWTSLLYESYWCQDDPPGRFSYTLDRWLVHSGGGWWKMPYENEDYEHGPPFWGYFTGRTGANPAQVTCTISFEPIIGQTPPTETMLILWNPDTLTAIAIDGPDDVEADGTSTPVLSAQVPPNTRFQVRASHNGAWANVGMGLVIAREVLPQ